MGDYAQDNIEREFCEACYDYDNGDYDAFNNIPTIYTGTLVKDIRYNIDYENIVKIDIKENDDWLLRIGNHLYCKLNKVVRIVKITDKAILFEFIEDWTNTQKIHMKGKQFWLPKSIIFHYKDHIKVLYIPQWSKINILN